MKTTALRNRQRGFSLIEIMVAVLVMSIGLLGLAALQATALSRGASADQRAQAVNAASELIDMVRANRGEANRYAGAFATGACNAALLPPFGVPAGNSMAIPERNAWVNNVRCSLPGASGNVQIAGGVIDVTIAWADARWEEDAANQATVVQIRSQL
ncbi:MAG: type IV pilus modification protein PilV [Xanthomonadales bacterium]|nr:type IV pilus modification protein PilV [Xanthomonadales bacterium]